MQPLTQRIHGSLRRSGATSTLLLDEAEGSLFLRYALVRQGSESHVFPALLLDDWGREHNSLSLYRWIYEEGQRFPRAELFGFDAAGRQIQLFLRELEIFFKYPCYVYTEKTAPIPAGERVHTISLPGRAQRQEVVVPARVEWPLRHAAVSWE